MRAMKRVLAAGAGLAMAAALTACNSDVPDASGDEGGSSDGVTTVGMGTQPWIGYGPWYIAADQGFDADHGVKLELVTFSTDADLSSAFTSGKMVAINAAVNSVAHLLDVVPDQQIVLFEDVSTTADAIIAGPDITSVADLEGKKVAYEEGTTSDLLLRYALGTAGLTVEDITPVPVPAANAGAALLSGDVDAAVTYEPYIGSTLRQEGDVERVFTAGEKPGLISDVLTIETAFAEDNPEAVQSLLRAWDDAVTYLADNPEEGQRIIAEGIGADPKSLATSFEGVQFYNLEESNDYLASEFEGTSTEVLKILEEAGDDTVQGVDLGASVETSYGTEAAKE